MRSVAGLVMQAFDNLHLVEVDILELSESPCCGAGIFHTNMGLWLRMVTEGIGPETDTGNG